VRRDEAALRELAAEQDGVLRRSQVLALGFTDERIEAELAARRWQQPHRGNVVVTTGVLTVRQRHRLALLTPGPLAALSHETAAQRWGMRLDEETTHVTVPYTSSAVDRPGIRLHRSRAFRHILVDDSDLPTVSPADTCLDLATCAPDARAAMRVLLHAALAMRVKPGRLRHVMDVRRPRRYRRPLLDAVTMLEDGVDSALEARYAVDVEDAHGLPRATRQAVVTVDGRARYEDCLYRLPRGEVLVRLDGWRYHSDRRVALVDRRRDNAAEAAGRSRLSFGWEEVSGTPCLVADEVADALRRCGWAGPATVSNCPCRGTDNHSRDASQTAARSPACA